MGEIKTSFIWDKTTKDDLMQASRKMIIEEYGRKEWQKRLRKYLRYDWAREKYTLEEREKMWEKYK